MPQQQCRAAICFSFSFRSLRARHTALFSSKPANAYSSATSKEGTTRVGEHAPLTEWRPDITTRLNNKEIGCRDTRSRKAARKRESSTGNDETGDAVASQAAPAVSGAERRGRRKRQDPKEAFRQLRADPTYVKMSREFAERKDPERIDVALDLAKYLVGKSDVEAERYFKEALACDPQHLKTLATFAIFLETVKKDFDHAERLYQTAALSGHRLHMQKYAQFLRTVRGDTELARKVEEATLEGGGDDDAGGARRRRRRHKK